MQIVRLAVIGVGLIGSHYARICRQMPGVELVAVQDASRERADAVAAELGVTAYDGTDCAALLHHHPDLDGVLVCTPEAFHVEPALAVLRAGKHLLVEKPLAANSRDAQTIADAAASAPGIAMLAYSLRFDPRYAAMKEAVDRGEIGEIIHLHARRNPSLDAYYRVNGRVELPFWVGVHDLDMLRWVAGSEIARVYASSTGKGLEERGAKRAILANLTFASGAVAVLENAWRAASTSSRQLSEASFNVYGTRGSIRVDSAEQGVQIVHDGELFAPDTVSMNRVAGEIVGTYRNQLACFVRCIRQNLPSPIPLAEGVQGVKAAEAILRSAETGEVVEIHPPP